MSEAFLLFFALIGVTALVLIPVGFATWVWQLRHAPVVTEAQRRAVVRRAFQRTPDFDPDEGMRRLAALITKEQR